MRFTSPDIISILVYLAAETLQAFLAKNVLSRSSKSGNGWSLKGGCVASPVMQFVYYLISKISRGCEMRGDQGMSWCNIVLMDAIRGDEIIPGWCAQKVGKSYKGMSGFRLCWDVDSVNDVPDSTLL